MGQRYVIDMEARFVDHITDEARPATTALKNLGGAAKMTQDEVNKLNQKRLKPIFDADDSKLLRKIRTAENRMQKLGRFKAAAALHLTDKTVNTLGKVTNKLQKWANTDWRAKLALKDGDAYQKIQKITGAAKGLVGKTWTAVVKIRDLATSPLRLIRNSLFSIQSLVMTIGGMLAAKQLIAAPINLADQYSGARIGFTTLLGETEAQNMMDQIDQFAKETPFKTSGVISNVQKMMAYGWDVDRVIEDMETIGDAAASTGKGDQGLESIVYALSEIRSKGKLSTQELNQLASAGIKAKAYLAEGLGYGTSDEGMRLLAEALEDGAIGANQAIDLILEGMKEFDGMMDATANETVEGLKSQIEDAFEINIVRRWGQGLQDGAKRGFGSFVSLLDDAEEGLAKVGDMLYDLGSRASNWVADKMENAMKRIQEITGSYEFEKAGLKEKSAMLWDGVVEDPLKKWWEDGGREKTMETAGKIGRWLGETMTDGLLAIFGMTDVLDDGKLDDLGKKGGMSIAQSFAQGFKENFDGKAITDAFVDAIKNVWNALPTWGKVLVGGYVGGKAATFVGGALSGLGTIIGSRGMIGDSGSIVNASGLLGMIGNRGVVGSGGVIVGGSGLLGMIGRTGVSGVGASGILGGLSKAGYTFMGGTSALSVGGGMAALVGAGTIAGGVAGGVSAVGGGVDIYKSYKTDDETERRALQTSGATKIGGALAGAAIGTLILPGIGTAIGAGIGGIAGWLAGEDMADGIRAAKYESKEMQEAIEDGEEDAQKLAEIFDKSVWENVKNHMGDMELSLSECKRLADQIVWGDDMGTYEQFTGAVKSAEANLNSLKNAAEQTNRWMWKAGLGVQFNEDEIESIVQSFDDYVNAAKAFVENKHYEFTAAVSMLVDIESEKGKGIIDSANAWFTAELEKVNKLGSELGEKVKIALEDGVIELNEEKEIINLQNQIAAITQKLADAEWQAELELIRLKFGSGNLDTESFNQFMTSMQEALNEKISASDEAFIAAVSNIKLRLQDETLTNAQRDQLNGQLRTLAEGYRGNIGTLQAEVREIELGIINEAYGKDLGRDSMDKLNKALNRILEDNLSGTTWNINSDKLAQSLFEGSNLGSETAVALAQMLSGVAQQMETLNIDGKINADFTMAGDTEEKINEAVKAAAPTDPAELTIGVVGSIKYMNQLEVLASEFGIGKDQSAQILWSLSGAKSVDERLEILASEFGITTPQSHEILWKLTGAKSVTPLTVTTADFKLPRYLSHNLTVDVTATARYANATLANNGLKEVATPRYRGGYVGKNSAMEAFARGGRANGGIVGGSTRYIRVNEESDEMIIPLSSQRRDRALDLWNKTGQLLGVEGFARGGHTGGGSTEGYTFRAYDSGEGGGQTVMVDVGGVNVQIQVDANGGTNVVEAIRNQAPEIAEMVAGIINEALSAQFENTPMKGGAA